MPLKTPRRSRKRVFYPPRTWTWVLTFWLLLLSLCFILARPPSIVAYYRQTLYIYLWTNGRRSVGPSILPWHYVPHFQDFTLRFWGFAMMQLYSVDWSLAIAQLERAWEVLFSEDRPKKTSFEVIASMLRYGWPVLIVFALGLGSKAFWESLKRQKQTIRAWLIGQMAIIFFVIGIWWATDGDFSRALIWDLPKESWLDMADHIIPTWWSTDGDISLEHTWGALKERLRLKADKINKSIWAWLNGSS